MSDTARDDRIESLYQNGARDLAEWVVDGEEEIRRLRADQEKTARERDHAERTAEARRKLVADAVAERQDMSVRLDTMRGALLETDKHVEKLMAENAALRLSDSERAMLRFAIEMAQEEIYARGLEFSDDDQGALVSLRRLYLAEGTS